MPLSDPIRIVKKVVEVFDKYEVKYLVGGSLSSSLHGIPRATQDVDIVADFKGKDIVKIGELLSADFFVDIEMMQKAVDGNSSFNIIDEAANIVVNGGSVSQEISARRKDC